MAQSEEAMNFEDAEIILYAYYLMYKAELKVEGRQQAEAGRRRRTERLLRVWRLCNPSDTSTLPVEVEARFRPCRACKTTKPLFLFRRHQHQGNSYSTRCMACEVEDRYLRQECAENLRHMCPDCGDAKSFREFGLKRNGERQAICLECMRVRISEGKRAAREPSDEFAAR